MFNTDEAMIKTPKLDSLGHILVAVGHLAVQLGTKLVAQRNALLAAALDDAHATAERAAYEAKRAAEDAYHLGRLDEAAGVPSRAVDVDEHQGDEHQDQAPASTSAPTRASSPAAAAAAKVAEWAGPSEFSSLTDD